MDKMILIITFLYIIENVILFYGLLRSIRLKKRNLSEDEYPEVSIIVAARNEESVIEDCIISLVNLDYPKNKMEIILVNDRSEDRTGNIMREYQRNYSFITVLNVVSQRRTESRNLRGKANALNQAIKNATGDIIFTTDADIRVKPTWAKELVSYYTENTGVVSSYSIISPKNFFGGIQSLDWLYLLTIACSSFGLNSPISCVGNNMSYRKKAYEEAGGYENLKFSVTEDFLLLQTIRKKTKWSARFPLDEKVMNHTLPCFTLKELYRQKKRWASGGLDSISAGLIIAPFSWIVSTMFLFGWIIFSLESYLLFITIKIVLDLSFIILPLIKFKQIRSLIYFLPFQIYYAAYVFAMPFVLVLDPKIQWKNRKF